MVETNDANFLLLDVIETEARYISGVALMTPLRDFVLTMEDVSKYGAATGAGNERDTRPGGENETLPLCIPTLATSSIYTKPRTK
jgi:hypothetical protein